MRPSPARLLPRIGGAASSSGNGAPRLARFIAASGRGRSSSSLQQGVPVVVPAAPSNLAAPGPQQRRQYHSLRRPRPSTNTSTSSSSCFSTLTHVDASTGQPAMVDVGHKAITKREARARCRVVLPPEAMSALLQVEEQGRKEVLGKKGPVFATAIVAGVMGAKRTSELVPFCHPLSLDDCQIDLRFDEPARPNEVVVDCAVKVQGRTGVEMEAMTGASVAALCVYDMCKAASHDIVIKDLQLLSKSGGKKGTITRAETISTAAAARSLSAAATPQPPKKDTSAAASAAAIERGKRLVMTSTYKGLNGGHPPTSFSSYSRPPLDSSGAPSPYYPAPPPSAAEARVGGEGRVRVEPSSSSSVGSGVEEGKKKEEVEAPVVDYCI